MKKMLVWIVVVVCVVGGLWYFGFRDDWDGAPVDLNPGWNSVVIPESWDDTTAKDIIDHSPGVREVAYLDANQEWVACLDFAASETNFAITAGMQVSIFSDYTTVALGG